ncbi:IS66 family insertion sequence element accessory protein TnpB [Sinorhizobium medicae]|uniref:IS66 family insertion sequence element accessory protein TnpB n=1 Tax=Sinorhizobium medicae TaxID=110321 RepID=UPI00192D3375
MIAFPAGVKVWIAGGVTDMRCGMNSLALKVQQGLGRDPHGGEVFCFRGRKGDLIKVLWHDGIGMSLYLKRLEAGKFIWSARMAPLCRYRRRSWDISWKVSTGAIHAGRSGLRRQANRLHCTVFVGLSACGMVAFGYG